ncbi:hypothetical protein EXIGLDRAFT_835596, partial [Exidia glandulosa HHB12029]
DIIRVIFVTGTPFHVAHAQSATPTSRRARPAPARAVTHIEGEGRPVLDRSSDISRQRPLLSAAISKSIRVVAGAGAAYAYAICVLAADSTTSSRPVDASHSRSQRRRPPEARRRHPSSWRRGSSILSVLCYTRRSRRYLWPRKRSRRSTPPSPRFAPKARAPLFASRSTTPPRGSGVRPRRHGGGSANVIALFDFAREVILELNDPENPITSAFAVGNSRAVTKSCQAV